MSNRLYLVDTEKNEHICIAKCFDYSWDLGNVELLKEFLSNVSGFNGDSNLIIGNESNDEFYNKWIKDGVNCNIKNEWIQY